MIDAVFATVDGPASSHRHDIVLHHSNLEKSVSGSPGRLDAAGIGRVSIRAPREPVLDNGRKRAVALPSNTLIVANMWSKVDMQLTIDRIILHCPKSQQVHQFFPNLTAMRLDMDSFYATPVPLLHHLLQGAEGPLVTPVQVKLPGTRTSHSNRLMVKTKPCLNADPLMNEPQDSLL